MNRTNPLFEAISHTKWCFYGTVRFYKHDPPSTGTSNALFSVFVPRQGQERTAVPFVFCITSPGLTLH